VLPGDSFHIAAVEPGLCAQHAVRFIEEVRARKADAAASGSAAKKAVRT